MKSRAKLSHRVQVALPDLTDLPLSVQLHRAVCLALPAAALRQHTAVHAQVDAEENQEDEKDDCGDADDDDLHCCQESPVWQDLPLLQWLVVPLPGVVLYPDLRGVDHLVPHAGPQHAEQAQQGQGRGPHPRICISIPERSSLALSVTAGLLSGSSCNTV